MNRRLLIAVLCCLPACSAVESFVSGPDFDPSIRAGARAVCALLPAAEQQAAIPVCTQIVSAAEAGNATGAVTIAEGNAALIGHLWALVNAALNAAVPTEQAWLDALPAALDAAATGCLAGIPPKIPGVL